MGSDRRWFFDLISDRSTLREHSVRHVNAGFFRRKVSALCAESADAVSRLDGGDVAGNVHVHPGDLSPGAGSSEPSSAGRRDRHRVVSA